MLISDRSVTKLFFSIKQSLQQYSFKSVSVVQKKLNTITDQLEPDDVEEDYFRYVYLFPFYHAVWVTLTKHYFFKVRNCVKKDFFYPQKYSFFKTKMTCSLALTCSLYQIHNRETLQGLVVHIVCEIDTEKLNLTVKVTVNLEIKFCDIVFDLST